MRRRDLEHRRGLERSQAMNGAGPIAKAPPGGYDLFVERLLARLAELEPRAAAFDVPALVLLPVELQRERLAGADEEDLPDVGVGFGPDQLPAPWLLDPAGLEGEAVERAVVRRLEHHASCLCGRHSGCSSMYSDARRRSFGVFTVSQTPS